MKRLNIVWLCLVAFLMAAPVHAQFKWGLEGGVNLSKAKVNGDGGIFNSSNRTGWFVGPKAQVVMPVIGLGLDGAILYSQKYMKLEVENESSPNKSMPYLEIPINIRYNIGLGSMLGVYVATGPQYSWYLGSRNLSWSGESFGRLERSTFSWNVGAGVNLLGHLQLGVTYNIALGQTGELNGFEEAVKKFDIKNNTCQVRLAYMF